MNTYIALFRGINVGGKNILPMNELIAILEDVEMKNIRTYIQSGNAIFQSPEKNILKISSKIGDEVMKKRGFNPHLHLMRFAELEKAITNNPYTEAENDPGFLHLGFLTAIPDKPDLAKLGMLKKESEQFKLIADIFYLHAPEGVGRSKLFASSEKLLGVPMTYRNWKTVSNIREIATE